MEHTATAEVASQEGWGTWVHVDQPEGEARRATHGVQFIFPEQLKS